MTKLKKSIFCTLISILVISISSIAYCDDGNNNNVIIRNGSRDKKLITITFDDGPHPKETNQVLDVLKKYDVKATFFVAGKHAQWYSEPLIRASSEGHEIGNHTFNHPDISGYSDAQIEREIKDCEKVLMDKTGKKTNLFRPPYGSYNKSNMEKIAQKLGYKIILWTTLDTKDWKNPSAQFISQTIIDKAQNGDIILLHDYGTEHTVQALDIFIPQMIANGYKFVTVSELIENMDK